MISSALLGCSSIRGILGEPEACTSLKAFYFVESLSG